MIVIVIIIVVVIISRINGINLYYHPNYHHLDKGEIDTILYRCNTTKYARTTSGCSRILFV